MGMAQENKLIDYFKDLPDPRMVNKCDHLLLDIIMIAICATIADADGWEDIAAFGEGKAAWLKQWLALPHGIPSPDTFQRVFAHLDAAVFQQRFMEWVRGVFAVTEGKATLHLVSAWATANKLTLGQVNVGEKANEIVAIPALLELLVLKGCIVTLDAMGCQKTIVKQLRDHEAEYVVAVKDNQPTLYRHLTAAFAAADARGWTLKHPASCQTLERQHGRVERRQCWVLADTEAQTLGWHDCHTLIRLQRTCQREGSKLTDETHYYISSLAPEAERLLVAVRAHWGIENGCHWVLDVIFHEDASRTRLQYADDNLALLRKIALNLIRQLPTKGSLKGKRYRAALNEDFLLQILQSSFNLMR
jgi:predicted transposase YbfD/YdcC